MGTKFVELTELTSLASGDVLAVVDVSDTTDSAEGTSKRITAANVATGVASIGAFALDSELAAHEADTTSVHGIADTSALYRAGGTDVAAADGGTGVSTAAANRIFAGPATGADAAPAFRALVSADIPNNAADTSGNAATATLAATATVANSGDSATAFFGSGTIEAARLGSGTPGSGNFLRGDSAWTALAAVATSGSASDLASGTVPTARLGSGTANGSTVLRGDSTWGTGGDVVGPSSATASAVALYDGTTGKLLKNCVVLIDSSGNVTGVVNMFATDVRGGDGVTAYGRLSAYGIQLADRPLSAGVAVTAADIGLHRQRAGEWAVTDGTWNTTSNKKGLVLSGLRTAVVTKTANYTAGPDDQVILVNASGGAVTITLPAIADANRGKEYRVKKIDSSGNAVTVERSGSDTIDGATSASLPSQYNSLDFVAPDSGTDWAKF